MAILRNYLKENDINNDQFFNQIKYTESQLSNHTVINYDDDVIESLARTLMKNKSAVLVELLKKEKKSPLLTINSDEDLKEALDKKVPYLYITPEYREERRKLVGSVLSEKDLLGLEIGSQGRIDIADSVINWVFNLFSSESKEFKSLENQLRAYRLKASDRNGMIIYKQERTY